MVGFFHLIDLSVLQVLNSSNPLDWFVKVWLISDDWISGYISESHICVADLHFCLCALVFFSFFFWVKLLLASMI